MSILQTTTKSPAEIRAAQTISGSQRLTDDLVSQWHSIHSLVWRRDRAETEETLAALGSDAAELIGLSDAITNLFASLLPGRRDDLLAVVQQRSSQELPHTAHEDGTVTLDPT